MAREEYVCPLTGKVDVSQDDDEAEWDLLQTTHIISRSLSERTKGVSEAMQREVSLLP